MNKLEFVQELAEELEIETAVTLDTKFVDLEEWDSMGVMVLIGFVSDNFNTPLNADDVKELTTFESLIEKIGVDKFN